jgi:predicted  nucleic acid-binding Zn-ribbon protein
MQRYAYKESVIGVVGLWRDEAGAYVKYTDAEQELERLRKQLAAANATIEQNVALINRLTEAGGHLRATIERLSAELNRGLSDSAHAARKAAQ